jgi:hypothetical protein
MTKLFEGEYEPYVTRYPCALCGTLRTAGELELYSTESRLAEVRCANGCDTEPVAAGIEAVFEG